MSAGVLMFRRGDEHLQVLLGHPGGPLYARKDEGVWSIPKGEVEPNEDVQAAAIREFREETGFDVEGPLLALTPIRMRSGKIVHAWAVEGDCDPAALQPGTFELEWPPKSGRLQRFPEIDRARFFSLDDARVVIHPNQAPWLDELVLRLEPS
ncbi:MAG: NUDIX domain-containing protein [Vicinamibacterales bacterium]